MKYSELAQLYKKLESTSKSLEKRDTIAEFLKHLKKDDLQTTVLFLNGEIFPSVSEEVMGIADKTVVKALSRTTGKTEEYIINVWKKKGDLGLVAEEVVKKKSQTTLSNEELTVKSIMESLRQISRYEGEKSTDKKLAHLSKLLSSAEPIEAKYLIRTSLGTLRIGVGFGIIRDAISKAFCVENKNIERAYNRISDIGEIVAIASEKGDKGLKNVKLKEGKPIRVMLYPKSKGITDGFERVGKPCAIEFKYDGLRIQVHKKGNDVKLFTRHLDDVTKQFPELEEYVKEYVSCKECILDSEAVAYYPETKTHQPFQYLSKRIKRKYDIKELAKSIPVVLYVFDIIYYNGSEIIKKEFEKRRALLEEVIKETKWKIELAKQLVTNSEEKANEFYQKALSSGQEGVMMKNLHAKYKPGSRVGYGVKVKPIMETLDLVITGAIWGEGKRSTWLSSFILSCKKNNEYLTIGKMATGLTEEQFEEMTKRLKPLIIKTNGRTVITEPKIVVEIGYEEIQKSPTYESGYALRFPRLIRVRDDKDDADTLSRVEEIYEQSH